MSNPKRTRKEIREAIKKIKIKTPKYYIGSTYKYEARKVIEDWNLSYNTGTAVSYLLRAGKKREEGMDNNDKHIEDINKAINHLRFEIDKLQK